MCLIKLGYKVILKNIDMQDLSKRKYALASLLASFSDDEQTALRGTIAQLLGISPKMLGNYINAKCGETKYSLNDVKLEKIREFFDLSSIDEVISKPPRINEGVVKSFKNRISSV